MGSPRVSSTQSSWAQGTWGLGWAGLIWVEGALHPSPSLAWAKVSLSWGAAPLGDPVSPGLQRGPCRKEVGRCEPQGPGQLCPLSALIENWGPGEGQLTLRPPRAPLLQPT